MPLFDDLAGACAWLDAQVNYERQLGSLPSLDQAFELEGFRRRLAPLGEPQRGLRTIHIAGTRGKGSAALALEALLRAAGQRTAVYTSPHLREYRERIRLDGAVIGGELFTRLLRRIAEATPAAAPEEHAGRPFKTVFENLTALFFLAARESGADWAIVETGLGGRLDATNVLDPGPVLLTRIGLEHTRLLGDTLTQIAGEKAAILKPGGWAVAGAQAEGGEAEAVFRARAAATGVRLDWAPERCPIRRLEPYTQGMRLDIEFMGRPLRLELGIYGAWQAENIQNALAMLTRLIEEKLVAPLAPEQVAGALAGLRIPGRMEKVCSRPEVFADGGHCPTAAAALAATMRDHFGAEPAGLLVGMMDEKEHEGFFRELAHWNHWTWVKLYQVDSPRAASPETLARAARCHFHNIFLYKNLEQALQSVNFDDEKFSRIVACGSLYSIARLQDWGSDHGCHPAQRPPQAEQDADHRHPGA